MASRTYFPIMALDRAMRFLAGRVNFGAASISSTRCLGFNVTRSGVGAYTLTMDDSYPKTEISAAGVQDNPFYGLFPTLIAATGTDGNIAVTSDFNPTTKVLTFEWRVGGVAADPANGASIAFLVLMRNTGTPRKGV